MIIWILVATILLLLLLLLLLLVPSNISINNLLITDPFTNNQNNQINSGKNILLIGDSMLNNSAYVSGGQSIPDLISKDLETKPGTTVYNFAKDGSTINDCYTQLDKISTELNNSSTIIFVSCGGNDILNSRGATKINVANLFAQYSELIKSIRSRVANARLNVLNLYFPVNTHYTSYYDTITQWNKLIEDNASILGYKVITTNNLLVAEDDFAYDIEPSYKGGKKIARAILDAS